ncbi:hypothetical protein [Kitasatospora sp. MAP5-34]|uniref:hypothetical protein n=1 Tax=Kitasatospora sp. MAP5-34 TaxID=3035102 RepID=UPI0024730077|nr:hypothetical protein [Kitasatospora sp. MAP5-34]MDH6579131.1 hypothetical protein [Kitasatospora sp. MAP5-34]
MGVAALEYSGLSTAAGTGAVGVLTVATGTTGSTAVVVASGATAATAGGGELALGFYADSGFGDTLTAGTGFTSRVGVSNTPDMELAVEDQLTTAGATPNATFGTGAQTVWLAGVVVFKHG